MHQYMQNIRGATAKMWTIRKNPVFVVFKLIVKFEHHNDIYIRLTVWVCRNAAACYKLAVTYP